MLKYISQIYHYQIKNSKKMILFLLRGGGLIGPSNTLCIPDDLYEKWTNLICKIALLNIGVESFDIKYKHQIYNLLEKVEFISLRDMQSFKLIKRYDKFQNVFLGADSTFLSPLLVKRMPEVNVIGVNLCGPEVENFTNNYSIINIVNAINDLKNLQYKIIAVNFSNDSTYNDVQYGKMVDSSSEDGFSLYAYERCKFFIGMRFHSILLALQNQIPCIAITYSDKVKRLMSEYNLDEYCLEPTSVYSKKLLNLLIKITKNEKSIVKTIINNNNKQMLRLDIVKANIDKLLN